MIVNRMIRFTLEMKLFAISCTREIESLRRVTGQRNELAQTHKFTQIYDDDDDGVLIILLVFYN